MRPIEIMLLLANLLTFIALAVPLPSCTVSWMRHCAPITLMIAFAQILVEGPRWQMFPGYVLAALFFVIWLLRIVAVAGKPATVTYHRVDASRQEVFSANPNAHRELMVQIWYPAKKESSSPRAPYIQDVDVVAPALARLNNFPDFSLIYLRDCQKVWC